MLIFGYFPKEKTYNNLEMLFEVSAFLTFEAFAEKCYQLYYWWYPNQSKDFQARKKLEDRIEEKNEIIEKLEERINDTQREVVYLQREIIDGKINYLKLENPEIRGNQDPSYK